MGLISYQCVFCLFNPLAGLVHCMFAGTVAYTVAFQVKHCRNEMQEQDGEGNGTC